MLIDVKNVSFSYGDTKVIENANFGIRKNEYICVIGDNGSGKSTLLKGILGLKNASKGEIKLDRGLKKNKIGYLPQITNIQKDFPATVYEVVKSGRISTMGFRPFYNSNDKKIVSDVMRSLGIYDIKNKSFRDLSGGQQRRALLARTLCTENEILFLDEPTAGLDKNITNDFYEIIRNKSESGTSIFMITHNIKDVLKFSTHVIYVRDCNVTKMTREEFENSELGDLYA